MSDFDRAVADHRAGRIEAAAAIYRRLLDIDPEHADAWHLLGLTLHQRGENSLAVPTIRRALGLNPQVANYHNSLGLALHGAGDLAGAVNALRTAVALDDGDADAYNNLGMVLTDLRSFLAAREALEQSLALRPDHQGAIYNLGRVQVWLGNDAQAVRLLREACSRDPLNATYWNTLGAALAQITEYDESRSALEKAIAIDPDRTDPHVILAHALLRDGQFKQGWEEHEWRLRRPEFAPRMQIEPWHGEDIEERTILLWAEQGLGDAIQFVRYAALVAGRGARVIIECPASLHRVFRTVSGVSDVVAPGAAPNVDAHAALMSMPTIFGVQAPNSYIKSPLHSITGVGEQRRVGLVWAGNPAHSNDHNRSHSLVRFAPLVRSDITFLALQKGPRAADDAPEGMLLTRLGESFGDFSDTAAALAGLDLLISVDTSVAHLAGALGIPTWLIVPPCPDWRWGRASESTVWYPSMRLFRQSLDEAPGAVFERLALALDEC